jgi:hypothetical protein
MEARMKKLWPALVLAAACGGGARTTTPTPTPATQPVVAPASKAAIDAFHEVLAPLWHSPESPERTAKTCEAVPSLEAKAQDVGDAGLVEAVHALGAECAGDRQAFQPRFATVHDAFHAAMEKAGAGHDDREHQH